MPSAKAYYNEWDPHAAEWIRNLVSAGLIADGDVDQRDIEDVRPADIKGYTQCHFFAGIGLWSYALRAAGWPDDRPVWTGSCPCQPFSASGDGEGFDDKRHLWPAWFWHIEQLRPGVIFGEQVASPDGLLWLDLVSNDLEARGYACGPVDFPSAGIGAPNIRQRLFWMADSGGARRRQISGGTSCDEAPDGRARRDERKQDGDHLALGDGADGAPIGLADTESGGRGEHRLFGEALGRRQDAGQSALGIEARGLADADGQRRAEGRDDHPAPGHDLLGGCVANGRVADAAGERLAQRVAAGTGEDHQRRANGKQHGKLAAGTDGGAGGVVDPEGIGPSAGPRNADARHRPDQSERSGDAGGGVADPERDGRGAQRDHHAEHDRAEPDPTGSSGGLVDAGSAGLSHTEPRAAEGPGWRGEGRAIEQPGGPFDPWRELEWIKCADGKLRPSQPGIFPLAPRYPGDVAKLRAYGNAINVEVAAEVIRTYLDLGR